MIDLNAIEKGADYSELPQSFVVFICTFDAFGTGRWKYTFQNVCKEDSKIDLNDDTTKLFFNTKGIKGRISTDAKKILTFIESNAAEDDFTKRLAAEVQKIKENKEWKVEYMTLLMREREKYKEGYTEGKAEGRAEGEARGAKGIIKVLSKRRCSADEIIDELQNELGVDASQAEDYLKRFNDGIL